MILLIRGYSRRLFEKNSLVSIPVNYKIFFNFFICTDRNFEILGLFSDWNKLGGPGEGDIMRTFCWGNRGWRWKSPEGKNDKYRN